MRADSILAVPVVALSALLLNAAPAVAQQDMVPVELVQHLIPSLFPGESGAPRIVVGTMPETVAGLITVPAGGRVIGSAVYPRSSRVVLGFPESSQPVLELMRERLIAAGWSRQELEAEGGFRLSITQTNTPLCGPAGAITLMPGRRTIAGEHVVMVVHSQDLQRTGCSHPIQARQRLPRGPIPPLNPPAGAEVQSAGSGSGGDNASARATVLSTMSPQELLRHYAGQLREHGWTAGEEAVAGGYAAQAWTLTDEEGASWFGLLTAAVSPERDRRSLRLEIERVAQRP